MAKWTKRLTIEPTLLRYVVRKRPVVWWAVDIVRDVEGSRDDGVCNNTDWKSLVQNIYGSMSMIKRDHVSVLRN